MRIKLITFNARFSHSCPALFYVRNELKKAIPGCAAEILQYTVNDPYYATLNQIGDGRPDALFISVYIWNSEYVGRLLADLPAILPDTPVILGGPQAPYVIDREGTIPEGCTLVRSEVEGLTPEFYQDLVHGSLAKEYQAAKPRSFTCPYRPGDFSGPLRNRQVYYESSRGCPFHCSYCLSSTARGVRHLPLDRVFKDLKLILDHNPGSLRFVDRTFNDNPDRSLAIWEFLMQQAGATHFHFEIAPDHFTEAMFALLAKVETGRFQFEIGIQSTNPATLAAIDRPIDQGRAFANLVRLQALNNIHLHVDLILGLPHETRESFRQSFNDVFAAGGNYIQMGLLKVLPETPIARSAEEFGLVFRRQPPYEILATRWLDHAALADLFRFGECVESFYNNRYFPTLWQYLRSGREDAFTFFEQLQKHGEQRDFFGRAPTQMLLNALLVGAVENRSDRELILELLIYDWLRCGHHFLPDELGKVNFSEMRRHLRQVLPHSLEGVYNHRSRDQFLKQAIFATFSKAALEAIGLQNKNDAGVVAFLPEKEPTLRGLQKTLLLEV